MSVPVSQFIPPPLSPLRSTSDFYVSISALIRLIIKWNVCQPPTLTLYLHDNRDSQAWWNSLKILHSHLQKMSEQGNPAPDAWPMVFPHLLLPTSVSQTCRELTCTPVPPVLQTPCRHRPPGPGLGTQASLSSLQRLASRRGPCWPGSKAGTVILGILWSRYLEYDPKGSPKFLVGMFHWH